MYSSHTIIVVKLALCTAPKDQLQSKTLTGELMEELVAETVEPRGNPCIHGENMQSPNKKTPSQSGLEPRTLFAVQ